MTTSLDALADAVVGAGITSIRGSIVGDGTRYDDEFVNPTWGNGVAYVDAGPVGGLLVNDGRTVGRSGRQLNPSEAAAREFARLLRERNVEVANGWEAGLLEPGTPVIAGVDSVPLSIIVADMLSRSDNDTAEMLLKEIGFAEAGSGRHRDQPPGARHHRAIVGCADGRRGVRRWIGAQLRESPHV